VGKKIMWASLFSAAKRNAIPAAVFAGLLVVTWSAMGGMGYRAGYKVAAGGATLDPELIRMGVSAFVALIGLVITKLPYSETLSAIWDQIRAKPVPPDPLALTGAEQRDMYERVCKAFPKPMDAMTKG